MCLEVFSKKRQKVNPEIFVSKKLFLPGGAAVVGRCKKCTHVLVDV